MSSPGGRRAQEHNEHTTHQERLLNAGLEVFPRDLGCTGGEGRGMPEEEVEMAHVVLLLGREGSGGISTPPSQPFYPW